MSHFSLLLETIIKSCQFFTQTCLKYVLNFIIDTATLLVYVIFIFYGCLQLPSIWYTCIHRNPSLSSFYAEVEKK
jgi:hypothetical protein